jgi:hypothetical protein
MQNKQYTGQGETIVVEESNNGRKQSPVLYERQYKRRTSGVPDYLPKWQWALLMRSLERQDRPSQIVVNHLRPTPKGSHWHTFKVAAITLVAAPIVLWAIPVVFGFYFVR